jgi:hypothetical protein
MGEERILSYHGIHGNARNKAEDILTGMNGMEGINSKIGAASSLRAPQWPLWFIAFAQEVLWL